MGVLSKAQGAYTAVDILKGPLSDVDAPKEFEAELSNPELQQFNSFEGPANADREILKAMKTAANADSEKKNPLLELVSLVLVRLGFTKGSKVLSLLLVACGLDSTLSLVVFKLCLLLARTEEGKKIVGTALPKIKDAIAASADRTQLDESFDVFGVEPVSRRQQLTCAHVAPWQRAAAARGGTSRSRKWDCSAAGRRATSSVDSRRCLASESCFLPDTKACAYRQVACQPLDC